MPSNHEGRPRNPEADNTNFDSVAFDEPQSFEEHRAAQERRAQESWHRRRSAAVFAAYQTGYEDGVADERRRARSTELARQAAEQETWRRRITTIAGAAAAGLLTFALVSGSQSVAQTGPNSLEEQGYNYSTVQVESVTISGNPNLRTQPSIADEEDGNNSYGQLGLSPITVDVDEVYLANTDNNGSWVGFHAEDLVNEGVVSEQEAELMQDDRDGVIWINNNPDNNTSVQLSRTAEQLES